MSKNVHRLEKVFSGWQVVDWIRSKIPSNVPSIRVHLDRGIVKAQCRYTDQRVQDQAATMENYYPKYLAKQSMGLTDGSWRNHEMIEIGWIDDDPYNCGSRRMERVVKRIQADALEDDTV
ncbi:hypothetical protein V1477_014944 [Vespula maculifrons]|uniref:Uncharacterized protein n=1 Tax=Vespula maculifrons TaxID=7453 RepID=A0ABD2BIV3_VESMC